MCVFSMLVDHYHDKWVQPQAPYTTPNQPFNPYVLPTIPYVLPTIPSPIIPTPEDIKNFWELLRKAKEYDEKNNQKDCQDENKLRRIKELLEKLGAELKDI